MNYIKHLTGFFNKSNQDQTITPTHISLYLALFQRWNLNRFKNPILISREEMMNTAKIKSKATYHKCIKDLHQKKYIIYKPSFNSYEGSEVILPDLSSTILSEQKTTSSNVDQSKPVNEPSQTKKQSAKSYPNHIQPSNKQLHKEKQTTSSNFDTTLVNELSQSKKQSASSKKSQPSSLNEPINPKDDQKTDLAGLNFDRAVPNFDRGRLKNGTYIKTYINNNKHIDRDIKKEKKATSSKFGNVPPTLDLIQHYFQEKNTSELEAEKFFNYYNSNGWLVGGKTPMKDWQAAARNWILNLAKFSQNKFQLQLQPKNLNVSNDKNYAEPL